MKKLILLIAIVCNIFSFQPALAQESEEFFFSDPLNLCKPGQECPGVEGTVQGVAVRIISGLIAFVGVLSFVVFIYSGVNWMLAAGNEQRIESSKKIMVWAIIGIVITFASYVILRLVFNTLNQQLQINQPAETKPDGTPTDATPSGTGNQDPNN